MNLITENREWLWSWSPWWLVCPFSWRQFWLIFRCRFSLESSCIWALLRWLTCNSTIDSCSSLCQPNTNRIISISAKWHCVVSTCSPSFNCCVSFYCGLSRRSTPSLSLSHWWYLTNWQPLWNTLIIIDCLTQTVGGYDRCKKISRLHFHQVRIESARRSDAWKQHETQGRGWRWRSNHSSITISFSINSIELKKKINTCTCTCIG